MFPYSEEASSIQKQDNADAIPALPHMALLKMCETFGDSEPLIFLFFKPLWIFLLKSDIQIFILTIANNDIINS